MLSRLSIIIGLSRRTSTQIAVLESGFEVDDPKASNAVSVLIVFKLYKTKKLFGFWVMRLNEYESFCLVLGIRRAKLG